MLCVPFVMYCEGFVVFLHVNYIVFKHVNAGWSTKLQLNAKLEVCVYLYIRVFELLGGTFLNWSMLFVIVVEPFL